MAICVNGDSEKPLDSLSILWNSAGKYLFLAGDKIMLITVIGRGHSGTRAMSHTLSESGVFMGNNLNVSGDLLPPDDLYEACRVMAKYVVHIGGLEWDFSRLHTMKIDPAFIRLVESYLSSVQSSTEKIKGWKIPETTLIFPWIVRLFPDIRYIYWIRDPRDNILGAHKTDDLADFGISYDPTDNIFAKRAISWRYQYEIFKATPRPDHLLEVRFEDFVLKQEKTLSLLETYLGFSLARIPVHRESVARWRTSVDLPVLPEISEVLKAFGYA